MTIQLENNECRVLISELGAEIISFIDKKTQTEFIWQGNVSIWKYHNPILFPVVGSVWKNEYEYQNRNYLLENHGFARDSVFEIIATNKTTCKLLLMDTPLTRIKYPFQFKLVAYYRLDRKKIRLQYIVENYGMTILPFQIGFHPALNCLNNGENCFNDCYLEFQKNENCISKNNMIHLENWNKIIFKDNLPFEKRKSSFFYDLKSTYADLVTPQNRIRVSIKGFDRFGLWHKDKDAPFVCFEPQNGQEDYEKTDIPFFDRPFTKTLKPFDQYQTGYIIEIIK